MIIVFGICMGLLVLTVSAAIPFADHTVIMDLARMLFVFLIFALSSDVFGVIRGHLSTAKVASAVYQRLSAAAAREYPVEDILLIVGDYNAAVESSPLPIPLVFKWRAIAIRRRWAAYQAAYSATQAQP
jgi:endonuclease/exonuclease/phosphatase (EEP) superfamily protein YafD